jgi:regulator of protease activity HflC (stomatin/prohibitin superfamily)
MMMEKELQLKIDEAKELETISLVIGIYCAISTLSILWIGVVTPWMGSDSFSLLVIPYLISLILAINTCVLGFLSAKAAQEEEDRNFLEKRKEKKALETGEDVLFSASRTLGNYRKYSPHVIVLLNFILIAVILFSFKMFWGTRVDISVPVKPSQAAFISVLLAIISIFAGIFCVGQSREKSFRWLRPLGGWLILSSLLGMMSTFAIFMHRFEKPVWEDAISKIIFTIIIILGIELLLNFIVEFYRPRTSAEERPVFESRILSLFTEPGGFIRNVADTLDYQFGFKGSKTWIYLFFEKSIIPLILLWLLAFWLFTCISEVGPGEAGVRESFEKIIDTEPLSEGIYLKLPWPFGNMTRVPVKKIVEITVGANLSNEKGEVKTPEVVLWTVEHYGKETKFIVAAEKKATDKENPVSYMSATFAIQYRAKENQVIDFAFRNYDIPVFIKSVSEREVSKYLASVDILKLMSVERSKAVSLLTKRIQDSSDKLKLGIEIVSLNLHDVHPPVDKVAPAFEEVASARQEKEAMILNAKAYENKILPYAEAEASKIIADAETSRDNSIKLSEAEMMRFKKQLIAYRIMPELYKLRTYLDFFEKDCNDIRKIVIGDSGTQNVYIFNFEEKARLDLIDAGMGEIGGQQK